MMKKLQEQKSVILLKEDEVKRKEAEMREIIKRKTEQLLSQNKELRQKDALF